MLFSILQKMRDGIRRKMENGDPSLYVSMAFPILFTFTLTFIGARIFSNFWPQTYIEWAPGLRVHHFAYGFFILAASGFIALATRQPKTKFWVAMLHGVGLGLAMDEFGMWLHLRDDDAVRWGYDGLNITIGLFLFILTARPGIRMLKRLWPSWPWRKQPPFEGI